MASFFLKKGERRGEGIDSNGNCMECHKHRHYTESNGPSSQERLPMRITERVSACHVCAWLALVRRASLRHGRITARKNRRLSFRHFQTPDRQQHVAVDNVNILGAIERWIRAFHAALYREPLSPETRFGIETPFAVAVPNPNGGVGVDSGRMRQHRQFVETIKHNRALGVIDQIVANNGKLKYECVWEQASNTRNWLCIFGLDIYNWADLGRTALAPKKGCVGFYQYLLSDAPATATKATIVRSTSTNADPLDPFGF
jgi:hypothetical protein